MTLKLRKQTNNLPHFDSGLDIRLDTNVGKEQIVKPILLPDTFNKNFNIPVSQKQVPNWSKGGNIAQSAVAFTGDVINAFGKVQSQNELMANAGTTQGDMGGIAYDKYNDINAKQEMDSLNVGANTLKTAGSGAALGASIGSVFPVVGTAVGGAVGAVIGAGIGIFGGERRKAKLRRAIANASDTIRRTNIYNKSGAQTDYLQQNYYNNNGDASDGILYANRGKDLKKPIR